MAEYYDVIVVGAGHAGCEAALAAARYGAKTLLLTLHLDHIAQMSCNPAVGGIAKGQLVREIDALGGAQGIVAEAAAIQFRLLNRGKGPAVWSPRAQCDKGIYHRAMKLLLERTENLHLLNGEAVHFLLDGEGHPTGIETLLGDRLFAKAIVLTTGTFLRGTLHYGLRHFPGGRAGDFPSNALSAALADELHLRLGRLKTGTPPRIHGRTIDFSRMEEQPSEVEDEEFCFWPAELRPELPTARRRHLSCHMVHSTAETAEIVRANLDQSPMYSGIIKGIGTRYCPSFEDKVCRFPHHPQHLLFLEPEGAETEEYYLNGFSSSLPPEVQKRMVHSLPGLEKAEITRYAYAIEYDFIPPEQTTHTLRNRMHPNLFTAGQINGTSGYEEAAGQGLVAGLNAARHAAGADAVAPSRDSSYLGVMVDDLATKEIVEPYRLFTSRAEYRLSIRQENADLRLSEWGYRNGILPEAKYRIFLRRREAIAAALTACRERRWQGRSLLLAFKELPADTPFGTPLPFPAELLPELPAAGDDAPRVWRELLIEARYDGYLGREEAEIRRLAAFESAEIPGDFDYDALVGLSNEARQKLLKRRPATLGQAGRIDGVTPADVALLQIALRRRAGNAKAEEEER